MTTPEINPEPYRREARGARLAAERSVERWFSPTLSR